MEDSRMTTLTCRSFLHLCPPTTGSGCTTTLLHHQVNAPEDGNHLVPQGILFPEVNGFYDLPGHEHPTKGKRGSTFKVQRSKFKVLNYAFQILHT